MGRKTTIAALIGNGMTIAYNPELTIPRITQRIIERLDSAGDDDTQQAQLMRKVAERAGRTHAAADFEELVSPFDELRDTLPLIRKMATLAGDAGLRIDRSLRDSAEFAQLVYRHGVSHVLDVIAAESRAHEDAMNPIRNLLTSIVNTAQGGEVTFANLNYDALLMAGLCSNYENAMCDLADGRGGQIEKMISPDAVAHGRPLRTTANLPLSRHVTLIHLHGSLAWLREPRTGVVYRFNMADVRDANFWTRWREGSTDWSPVVVLTNQTGKTNLIKKDPFKLAYEVFYQRLLTADKWLIAGTSLRDEGVNQMLQLAWSRRTTCPQVLVVTRSSNPTERQILDAIGWDPVWAGDPDPTKWLTICRDGILEAPDTLDWAWWSASGVVLRAYAS
ncbi:hypothetical protein MLP_35910 [Microlunatus phosphovorus NM-1]|uniref:Uncharacterized protein n=1 Tax=Microlunatus phosphovorus (strain ATCC 700054 / DSM 10555 / JCM 9379 / NBRC 101784 / NCIMB 13414 / VKM Ac-1990 / NM-1) TaxID=1032480 RepID=F5XNF5_MICPN|nr:SIR2 family protein [Microlunatus phosphovorus]BAK36605.1 hypothetical protein MLP_35910 [Microlunatus phosphovorus NM-1]